MKVDKSTKVGKAAKEGRSRKAKEGNEQIRQINKSRHITQSTLFFFIRICFIRISGLKFAKFLEYFKNKAEAKILKRIGIILCAKCFIESQNGQVSFDETS